MRFLDIPLRDLWRRPLRTSLTLLGVAIGIGSFVALNGISRGCERAVTRGIMARGTHVMAYRRGTPHLLTAACDERLAQQIARADGVRDVVPELVALVEVSMDATAEPVHVPLTGWPVACHLWETLRYKAGGPPRDAPGAERGIALGESWAEALGLGVGARIEVFGHSCRVSGVVASDQAFNRRFCFMALDGLQEIALERGRVTNFNLRLSLPADERRCQEMARALDRQFPDLAFYPSDETAQNTITFSMLRAFTHATALVAMLIALVVVANTLLMNVTERLEEIGIYAGLGWSPARVLGLVLAEGFLVVMLGGALGMGLGFGFIAWFASIPSPMIVDWQLDPTAGIEVIASVLALGLAGSLYPAWHASRMEPVAAMHLQ